MNDRVVGDLGENKGIVKRTSFTRENKLVAMMGIIHSNVFFQEKLLMNGINARIRFIRNKDSYGL